MLSFLLSLLAVLPLQSSAVRFPSPEGFEWVESRGVTFNLFQDERGMIWAGTQSSVQRFKGNEFSVYKCAEPVTSFASEAVNTSCHLGGSIYWLGTSEGMMSLDVELGSISKLDIFNCEDIRSFERTEQGGFIVCTASGAYDYRNGEVISLGRKALSYQVVKSGKGKYLICSYAGPYIYDEYSGETVDVSLPSILSDGALSACADTIRNCVWIGTNDAVYRLASGSASAVVRENLPKNTYKTLMVSSDGELWAGTEKGLVRYNPDTRRSLVYRHNSKDEKSLCNNVVWSLLEDDSGDIWVGTNNGVCRLRRNAFLKELKWCDLFDTDDDNNITAIAAEKDGALWLAGDCGVGRFDGRNNIWYREEDARYHINKNAVRDICIDSSGDVWIATDDGINLFENGVFSNRLLCDSSGTSYAHWCYGIMDDLDGKLWVSSYDGGIFVSDRGLLKRGGDRVRTAMVNYSGNAGLPDTPVKMTRRDSYGHVWAMMMKAGLFMMGRDTSCVIRQFDGRSVVSSSFVIGADNRLWAPIDGGILLIDTGTLSKELIPIPSTWPLKPLFELGGNLWVLASDRIFIVNGDSVETLLLGSSGYSCGILYGNDTVVLGGFGKLGLLSIREYDYRNTSSLYLTSLRAGGEEIAAGKEYDGKVILDKDIDYTDGFKVPWSLRHIDLDIYSPSPLALEYSVDGDSWHMLGKMPATLSLHGLDVGSHTLSFRQGESHSLVRNIDVRILPAWYAAWYMMVLYVLLSIVLISLTVILIITRGHLKLETAQKEFYLRQSEQNEAQLNTLRKLSAPMEPGDSSETSFIKGLSAYISEHMGESDISVQTLSDAMSTTPKQLYRKVKSATGLTVVEYVRDLRLQAAAQLLKSGELNVTETMYKVGFSNPSYFTKCFIELYGVSPKNYRKL